MAKQTITYSPQILDLLLYAGDGVSFRLVITDPDGAPVNLTGTMLAQIRTEREAPDPPSAEFDIDLTNASGGIAVLNLTGEQTHELTPTKDKFNGVWDVQWTAVDAEPITLCQGVVGCMPDVTH